MSTFKYKAVRIKQTASGNWLVLFAASAIEIDMWAGVPQKKKIGEQGQETTGFQREENRKRIKEISEFSRNEQNIVQNPLLCALRQPNELDVKFELSQGENNLDDTIQHGFLTITTEPLEKFSLLELLKRVKTDLERRVPELVNVNQRIFDQLIRELKQRAAIQIDAQKDADESIDFDNDQETPENSEDEENLGISLTDESHILDFWQEIAAYVYVLEEIKDSFDEDIFLDYSKNAIISFLRPLVVVDGQHRLRAAVTSAKALVNKDNQYQEYIEQAIINDNLDPEEAQRKVESEAARKLAISLLMNTDPAEQVFQFVVVNQKATPIKSALLGTIISTSLSNDELCRVSDRLEAAGIKLEESRAVTFLTRYPKSPFYGLVERGLTSDNKDNLKSNVLASIVKIFRELKDGRLFHENVDYADKWKRSYLPTSKIVDKWESEGFQNDFTYWGSPDDPWRDVFISFWTSVRDKLSDPDNEEAWHYWGNPKKSNIFNHTSLKILASDFFQYLCGRGIGIDSAEAMPALVNEWLTDVNSNYFNRDWNLHGVKKDVPGIRKQWAKLWVEYRKDPQRVPKSTMYRVPLGN